MEISERIIKSFERLSLETLKEFTAAKTVMLKSNGSTRECRVTSAPYFKVSHLLTLSPDAKDAEGVWWIDIEGRPHSLMDWNVIPNVYNNHSMTVLIKKGQL